MTVDKPFFLKNEGADCWYRLYFNNVSGSLSSVLEVTVSDGETVLFTGKMSDLTQSSADWLGILPAVGAAAVSYTHLDVYKKQSTCRRTWPISTAITGRRWPSAAA